MINPRLINLTSILLTSRITRTTYRFVHQRSKALTQHQVPTPHLLTKIILSSSPTSTHPPHSQIMNLLQPLFTIRLTPRSRRQYSHLCRAYSASILAHFARTFHVSLLRQVLCSPH